MAVGEDMLMLESWERWVQLMAAAAAMWVEVVWWVVVVAWCEHRATENACRGRSYGSARRGSKRQRKMPSGVVRLLLKVSSLVSVVSVW